MKYIQLLIILFISFSVFGNGEPVSYDTEAPLMDHLISINKEWTKQKDIPTHLMTIPMKFNTDEERIQLHLQLVEKTLKARQADHLTVQQFINRQKNLESLMAYWKENKFPINTRHSHRQPYFIDDFGTACAVGHLLLTSGGEDLAHHISDVQNYAYIHEMNYPKLYEWASKNGFTEDELAWIQPGYAGATCYSPVDVPVPEYSAANQPLNQQEIKVMMTLPDESMMLVGGSFLHFDSAMGIQTASIFGYDGSDYISFGDAIQGTVYDIEYYDGRIYVAGDFVLSGTNFYNIAYWNGTTWIGVQTGNMNGIIRDIASYECQLYVGGDFTMVNANAVYNLAIWDGTVWSMTPQNCAEQNAVQTLQVNASVNTFEVYNDKLAIGGAFTQANNTPVEGLIFLDDIDIEFPPAHGSMTSVDHLESYETALMVGGDSLYAYRWNKWYYPSDTIYQYELLSSLIGRWQIPEIGRTNTIFYRPAPEDVFYTDDNYINHLVISADDNIWGINGIQAAVSYGDVDYHFTVNGSVSSVTRFDDITYHGGNFNIVTALSNPFERDDCDSGFASNKIYGLQRVFLLPIELANFTVKSNNNQTAHLKWTSMTEKNSLHYEVQRKTDNQDFTRIGIVNAAGESLQEINYTFEDDISTLTGGHVYYRLKMVDKDGSFEYSDIRSLKLRDTDSTISIYPNPAQDAIAISMDTPSAGNLTINIYNLQGQQINSYQRTYDDMMSNPQINVSHLQSGMYIIEIISPNEQRITEKFIIG